MRRRAKPARTKLGPALAAARKSVRNETSKRRELEKRLAESLEREQATAEILRVISSSPTDVQPVLDAVAEHSARLCGALFASVYQFDGELIHRGANYNYPPLALERSRQFFPTRPNRQLFTARAILERAVVHVPDVQRDNEYAVPDFLREVGCRSVLSVPMLRDGNPIGAITVWRAEVGPFTDRQVALLKTFADQAVIAIENVRLVTELEGRNRDLTATSEILRVISSSPTDVQPVFDAIATSAVRLLGGFSGTVLRLVGEDLHLAAITSTSEFGDGAVKVRYPRPLADTPEQAQAIWERVPSFVIDMEVDPRIDGEEREVARARGYRSRLRVPMLREETPIGLISVTRREPGPFAAEEIALLQTFADQAVIAIENLRLFKELQARTGELTRSVEQLTALGEISRAVSSTLDVETVLATIVSRASQLAGAAGCSIFEYDEGAEQFELRATYNDDTAFVAAFRRGTARRAATNAVSSLWVARSSNCSAPSSYS